jgi:hypothetical protein
MNLITIWAGIDIYSQERVPSNLDQHHTYLEVYQRLHSALVDEFGVGVELIVDQPNSYHISADKVQVTQV